MSLYYVLILFFIISFIVRAAMGKALFSRFIKNKIIERMEKRENIIYEGKFWYTTDSIITIVAIFIVFYYESYHPVFIIPMVVYIICNVDQLFFRHLAITDRSLYYFSIIGKGFVVVPFALISEVNKVSVYNAGVNVLVKKFSGEKKWILSILDCDNAVKHIQIGGFEKQ